MVNQKIHMSPFGKLSWRDFVKGLFIAVVFAILTFIQQHGVSTGNPMVDGTIAAIVSYLIKNVFTDNQGKLGGKI